MTSGGCRGLRLPSSIGGASDVCWIESVPRSRMSLGLRVSRVAIVIGQES